MKKFARFDESWFLLQHSDYSAKTFMMCKQLHESMNNSPCWWLCNDVGWFSWQIMGQTEHILMPLPKYCCLPCLLLCNHSVPIFWWLLPAGNPPCLKAQIISNWFLKDFSKLTQMVSSHQLSTQQRIFGMWGWFTSEANRYAFCCHVNIDQILCWTFFKISCTWAPEWY